MNVSLNLDDWEIIYTDADMQMLQTKSEIQSIKSYFKSNRLLIKNLFSEIESIVISSDIKIVKRKFFYDFFNSELCEKYINNLTTFFKIQDNSNLVREFNDEISKEIMRLEDISLTGTNDFFIDIRETCIKLYILVKKSLDNMNIDMTESDSNQIILLFFPIIISVIFD